MTSEPALAYGQRAEVIAARMNHKEGKHYLDGAVGIVRNRKQRNGCPFVEIELQPQREDGVSGSVWVPEAALKRTE